MTESAETDENIVTSDKEHHDNLSYHHSDKHAERINRSITDAWRIAIQCLVGVSKRHRIRHTSTEDSADTAEVILLGLQDDETYNNHRHNRDKETDAYPHQTFRTDYRLEELSTSRQSQATEMARPSARSIRPALRVM